MKTNELILIGITILTTLFHANAQSLLNGDFENTTGNCDYGILNSNFQTLMDDCYAFGSASQIDILDSTCGFGYAQSGMFFIGIAVAINDIDFDALSMTLNSPLMSGQNYTLTFFQRKDPSYISNDIEIGYSNDSLVFGNTIDIISAPTSTTNWDSININFAPTQNAKFITIRTIPGEYGWNFIDHFSISSGISNGLTESSTKLTASLYPNPSTEFIQIDFTSTLSNLNLEVVNMYGQHVLSREFSNLNEIKLNVSNFADGVYFLKIEALGRESILKFVKK